MFSRFIEFFIFLSSHAITWYFSLVTLLFKALPLELQETVQRGGGVIFSLTFQLSPLLSRKRGNFKICVKSLIRTKIWMMKAIVWKNWIHLYNSHTSTTNFQTDVDCKYNNSLADKTICVVINKEWPLVKGKDDKLYH